jgi:hypothetical protein
VLFDRSAVPDIHISIPPLALDVMTDETYVHAAFRCGNTVLDPVGVRYKGYSSYFFSGEKKPYKVDFNRVVPGQTWLGLRKLNLNNNWSDPSMMRETLSYDLLRETGIPTPHTGYANLYINGAPQGLYTTVEQVDRTFLRARFADDSGNLFKAVTSKCDLTYRGGDPALYAADYELRTNEEAMDYTGFIRFLDVLNNAQDTEFHDAIAEVFDVDGFLWCLAVDTACVSLDNYGGHARNYYLYEDPTTGRFVFIPWDYNMSFGGYRGGWSADELLDLDIYQPLARPPSPPPFYGLGGSGPADAWCVGDRGAAARWKGAAWAAVPTGSNRRLRAVWAASPSDAAAVGDKGTVLRFDGTRWAPQPSGTSRTLWGVWGSGPANVFAVGSSGRIVRWDGAAWTPLTSGGGPTLYAVWGSAADDVFIAGSGVILRGDGAVWSPETLPLPTPPPFFGIWGSGASDVFAVGNAGTILHFGGSAWSEQTSGTTAPLRAVWGSSGSNVYAVGDSGTVLRYDGANWTSVNTGSTQDFDAVWGTGPGNVFVAGRSPTGLILRFDGSTWTSLDSGIPVPPPAPRPLVTRLLADAGYRAVYEQRLRLLLAGSFTSAVMDPRVDSVYALIASSVYSDPLKEFTDQEFDDSLSQDIPPTGSYRTLGLKPFVVSRSASIFGQLP